MNLFRPRILFLSAIAFIAQTAIAQAPPQLKPFTADMDVTSSRGEGRDMTGKMYVGQGAMRMEMQGGPRNAIILTNFATKTVDIIMPDQHMYMEHKASEGPGRRGPNFSDERPYDPENPCAADPDLTCKKIGVETVNGRTCNHWQVTHKDGTVSNLWIDQKLHFPIKTVTEDSTFQLTNVQEGEPPADLFQVPSGYRKMEMPMGGMMPHGGPPQQ